MKVLCVGKNYDAHARELDGLGPPPQPLWFWKPDSAIIQDGASIELPARIGRVDHEVELALRIGPDGEPDAYTVAIDVTARDLQAQAKAQGWPWAQAKGYDTFLPLGPWRLLDGVDVQDLPLRLSVNGELRQDGHTADMVWPVAALLRHAASWTTLRERDVLLTGTPAGVGPIVAGDELAARAGEAHLRVSVVARSAT